MNDDTDKPLNTVGDDALEARITAWVLGEASSFEAGELEKLCAADPALGLFERRLRVLNGLVAEDFKTGPAAEWKLSAERRAKVTDLLGVEPEVELKIAARRRKSRGSSVRGLILALAACVVLGFISISLIGGVGDSARMVGVKSSVSHERFAAEAPMAMAPSDDYGAVADRSAGAPAAKPDTSYAHLADNSAFTSKPAPPAVAEVPQIRGMITRQEDVVEDKRKLLAAMEVNRQGFDRDAAAAGIANETAVDTKAEFDEAANSLALLKEKATKGGAAGVPEQQMAARSEPEAIAGPPPATAAIPAPAPPAKPDALAANERGTATRAKGEVGFGHVMDGAALKEGKLWSEEGTPEIATRTNTDFILPAEGMTIPGIPAAPGSAVANPLTSGNRSGDGAISRNNIDAILNNPAGDSKAEVKGDGLAAVAGASGGEAGKEVTGSAPSVHLSWAASTDDSGSVSGYRVVPNPTPGEPANGAFGRGVDTLADAGGVPQEPAAHSRFALGLRGGSERTLEQDEATAFGNGDDMGWLSKDRQQAPELKLGENVEYHDSSGAMANGIADLTDLAKKQNEANSAGAVAGRSRTADESSKGLEDVNSPGGAPADPFFETPLLPGQPVGGLKRDLSAEHAAAPVDAEGEVRAKLMEQIDKAWALPVPTGEGLVVTDASNSGLSHDLTEEGGAGRTGLVQKEMIRRQSTVVTSDTLRDEARAAYADGKYQEAVAKYKESLTVLPDAPMVADRRKFLEDSLGDAAVALSDEYRKVGKYEEARQLAAETLAKDANNADAKRVLDYLDDPIRTNPALTYENAQNVDEVRRKLYTAEGSYNLGKYDDAHRVYEDVLRIDPHNKAARRGMEQVAMARSDYYRAAYDQTRAQLLADVDQAWELSVPPLVGSPQLTTGNALMVDKRESVVIPEFKLENATVDEALDLLRMRAVEYDTVELDPAKRGVPFVLAKPAADAGAADPGQLRIRAIDLKNVKLGDAIQEIARQSGLEVEVGADAVTFRTGPETISKADQIVDLMSETSAADEPFSTFSLHVSDASFKLAQAAMERGEVPAAEGIRPEEFYNAFDYGDPAPGSGEPVVCVTEQSAHPAFAQRNLLRIGVRTGSQGRGASTPLNLTLLLDHSGSMEREDRNAGLAMAVRQLSGLLKEGDTITVAGFSRQPRLLADRLPGARAQELNELIARTPSEGGTNLEEGLKLGEELAKRQFNPAAQNRVVLFTDGAANLGDARPEALQARIEGLRQQGIAFDAAGFGADGLNDKLLERLTRNGNGRYYVVDGPEDADAGFAKQLAGAFRPAAENVKVQVRFNPARVAKYKLIGFEEHRLQKEDFRNDAVDAAEMAAEEAGNALYQIETLPQGEGEVGEVSVRFRDVASGQMVERTWTIPFDAQAPAFDRATPSIQLAGLAAFTAEKLRGAPMADAVDFQQLGQVYAGVRARYPNSQPVADLGSMIGKMK